MGLQRSKYKKVILAVFPIDTNGDIQMHNMGKLVHFCELTPQKLPKVATFLEKRVDSDLAKGRLGYVEVSMKIFNELIKGCRKHLPLFAGSLVKLMKLLFEKNEYPALKIIATETFTRFADVQDEATQYNSGVEDFVNYFVGMCRNENTNAQTRTNLRISGLRGLRAYIVILDYADELDSFVSKQSQARIIPTILDNMQYEAAEGLRDPENMNNVSNLATEVLRDLSSRVNNITVTAVVSAVLNYLDAHNMWIPNIFAIHCLQTISFSLKPQHNQIMMTRVLQHLESTHTIQVTMQIVDAITTIVSDSTGPVTVVLSSLVKLLVLSVEQSAQTPPPVNIEEHLALQATLIECVGAISKKFLTGGQKMDAMGYLLAQCEEVRLRAGSVTLALALAQCVLAVGGNLLPADGALVPGPVVSALMELAANADPQVRVLAQKTIHCTLLPGRSLEQLSVAGSANEFPLSRYSPSIRESIYNTTLMKTNQPENLVAIFHTLAILLLRARTKELPDSIQLIIKLQHKASKKRFPILPARSIHAMVAAYLLLVAKVYEYNPLAQYVAEIQAKREAEKQTCRYIETKSDHSLVTFSVKKPKYSESVKHRTVTVFFDREVVIDLLCGIPSLSKEYGKRETLRRALSRNYSTNRGKAHSTGIPVTSPPVADPFSRPALSAVSPLPTEDKTEEMAEVPASLLLNHSAPKSLTVEALRKALAQNILLRSSDSHPQIHSAQSVSRLLTTQHDYQTTATHCADAAQSRTEVLSYLQQPALPPNYDPTSFEHFFKLDEDPAETGEEVVNVDDFSVCSFSPLSLDLSHPLLAH